MAESQDIIITFKADTTGLTPAVELLEKMGLITRKDGEEFRKLNAANNEFNKTAKNTAIILDGNGKQLLVNANNVRKFGEESAKAGKQVKESSKEIEGGFGGIKNALSGIAEGIAAAFAVQKILAFAKESINAFVEAEAQTNRLKFAIENITKDGGAFDSLVKQSQDLEKLTFFDSEDIQNAQAMQAQFGLTSAQIKKLTPLITELAAAQSIDLASATDIALKAIEGQTRGLKVLGADFKDTGDKVANYNILIDNLGKFQGTAADALLTTSGQLKKQAVELENLQEEIGQRLAPAFVNLKRVILEAGASLSQLIFPDSARNKLEQDVEKLKDILKFDTTSNLKAELDSIPEKIKAIKKEANELPINLDRGNKLEELSIKLRQLKQTETGIREILLERAAAERSAAQESVRSAQVETLKKENLLTLTKKQLEAEIAVLKARKDANTIDIKGEIERRELAIDKIAESNNKQLEQRQKFADELTALEKDIAKKSELELAKTEQERLAITLKYALLELDIKRKAAGGVDTDKAYLTAKKNLYDAYDKAVLDADNKQKEQFQKNREKDIEADSKAQEAMVKNLEETNDETNKLNEEQRQLQLDLEEQFRQDKKALINQIEDEALQASFGLFQANIDAQLALLEEQTTQEQEVYDERIRLNQEQFDKRIITAKQFRAEEDKLNKEKVAAEKVAQTQINELRRKADIADRAEKVFQIAIATARNIAEQPGPVGALIPFWVGVGAFQIAAVLAQPLPKYAKGTLSLQGNNDEVPIIAHRGEAITPTKQSKEYNATLRAIHERSIPAEALNNFVKGFNYKPSYVASTTTANSFSIDYDKLAKSIAWQMRGSGNVNIKNVKQIADALKQDNDVRRYRG